MNKNKSDKQPFTEANEPISKNKQKQKIAPPETDENSFQVGAESDTHSETTDTAEVSLECLQEQLKKAEEKAIKIEQKLKQSEEKAAENWNQTMRTLAETENFKKRMQKDMDNAHKYGLEKFVKELLVVIDSLESGITQASNSDNPEVIAFREGSALTVKQLEAVFVKFHIEALNPIGQPFNPELHQAMMMQASEDVVANTVLNVFQKGYVLNGRLIRPATVVVSQVDKPTDDVDNSDTGLEIK